MSRSEREKEYDKKYYEANKDKFKEYNKEYYLQHKEKLLKKHNDYHKETYQQRKDKIKKTSKKYYEQNKDKIKNTTKIYQEKNKDRIKEYSKTKNHIYLVQSGSDKDWYIAKDKKQLREYFKKINKTLDEIDFIKFVMKKEIEVAFNDNLLRQDLEQPILIQSNYK